jgi:hypothetical protein
MAMSGNQRRPVLRWMRSPTVTTTFATKQPKLTEIQWKTVVQAQHWSKRLAYS